MSVESQIKGIVVRILHCADVEFTPATTFKDLKADSLDLVQILVALEDTFDIEISDEDAEGLASMGDMVAYIERALAEQGEKVG